jgi:hypothetical protein
MSHELVGVVSDVRDGRRVLLKAELMRQLAGISTPGLEERGSGWRYD